MDKKDRIKEIKDDIENEKKERYNRIIDYWKTRKPFVDEDDIPDIPVVDKEDYENIIIPNLIRCGAIPKDKLVIGGKYIGSCRNASEAIWNGKKFVYKRYKFGFVYDDDINHFQDDDGYDVFVPIKYVEEKR